MLLLFLAFWGSSKGGNGGEGGGSEEGWKTWYGRRADALASAATLTWESANQPLPTFEIADLHGKTWTTADLKGKVTFLNFWASW